MPRVILIAYSEQMWQDAEKKCRLNNEDITLAKQLGLNPHSLVKNIPSKSGPWKAPVGVWLHETEAKHQKRAAQKQRRRAKTKRAEAAPDIKGTP